MNSFVNDGPSLFNYIINNKSESSIFCNDKSTFEHYHAGRRDRLYGMDGSFYAALITFATEKAALVEVILIISTYGVKFCDPQLGKAKEREFERNLALEVMPYYLSLIQAELGAIYIRNNWTSTCILSANR